MLSIASRNLKLTRRFERLKKITKDGLYQSKILEWYKTIPEDSTSKPKELQRENKETDKQIATKELGEISRPVRYEVPGGKHVAYPRPQHRGWRQAHADEV